MKAEKRIVATKCCKFGECVPFINFPHEYATLKCEKFSKEKKENNNNTHM